MTVLSRTCFLLLLTVLIGAVHAADAGARLVAAATSGRAGEVRDLLAEGIDANTKNASGRPVIVLAGFNGNRRTVRTLLAAGA
ncbi:MAG: ankyrin repeat domain-containing protein, partial [Gammaproteobacteria bacterium]|nr:ankyrin repeat domain-containing protein [Gammaproteobacteria bacterium]